MFSNQVIFLGLVFVAVLFLSQALFLPVYSPQRANTALVRKRLKKLSEESGDITYETSLLRKSRLGKLGSIGRWLESFELIESLSYRLELADYKLMGHQFIGLALVTASLMACFIWAYFSEWVAAIFMFVPVLFLFNFKLNRDTSKRMDKIEESFPDALDVLRRALQAGYSFSDAV
ncbi:type II secretion system F family protein, partial [Shewanella sp. MBTL60-112-B1]|uniref:type II secretion system F family protein n=1 Tax=Shewanella sp. MBTL60-112-B1 TaxID=2815916 RepID=UPI0035B664C1